LHIPFPAHLMIVQGAYKLSEDFAKPYFHKYWREIHDVTTIWNRNFCSLHYRNCESASTPQSGTSHKTCLRGFGGNGSIALTSSVSHVGRTSNEFKITTKLQTFLFEMVVTSCISVQYLWKYGYAKSSDNFIRTLYYSLESPVFSLFPQCMFTRPQPVVAGCRFDVTLSSVSRYPHGLFYNVFQTILLRPLHWRFVHTCYIPSLPQPPWLNRPSSRHSLWSFSFCNFLSHHGCDLI